MAKTWKKSSDQTLLFKAVADDVICSCFTVKVVVKQNGSRTNQRLMEVYNKAIVKDSTHCRKSFTVNIRSDNPPESAIN